MSKPRINLSDLEEYHIKIAMNAVALSYEVAVENLKVRDRHENLAMARMTAYWMLCRLSGMSTTRIGFAFGRDHGAVISGRRKIQGIIDTRCNDHKFLTKIEDSYRLYKEFADKHNVEKVRRMMEELENALRVV